MGPDVVVPAQEESEADYAWRQAEIAKVELAKVRADQRAALRARLGTLARQGASLVLELVGIGVIAYGLFTEWPWLGMVVGGLGVILVGVAIDPPLSRRAPEQSAVVPFMTPGGRYEGP